ncbi:MAG: hypothetical protein ABL876_06150, partial [Chitinophagaceae bacterium]
QQQFDSLLLTRESIRYYGLKEKVAGLHQQMMTELTAPVKKLTTPVAGSKRIIRYVASVAASIILLVGGFMAYNFFTLSSDKVYGANYQKFELSTTRDPGLEEAASEKAYRAGNYKEVVRLHDAAATRTAKEEFLCGVAAMELKDNTKAINCFTEVLQLNKQAPAKVLNDESEYYLSLAYVSNKDYDFALDIMHRIKEDPTHIYNAKITRKLIRQVKLLKWR